MSRSWAARLSTTCVLCLLCMAAWAQADVAVPPLTERVTDLTATLRMDQKATLEQALAAFEAKKGSQIAVLIVPTTQPETIEQYSIRVVDQWKLGRKGVDDGVLLLVAKQDRRVRIEVGYGLEGAIPDAGAKRIVEEDITPHFRDGDFYGGIAAGLDRIMRVIDGEPLPPVTPRQPPGNGGGNFESLLLIGCIFVFVAGGILRAIFGRFLSAGIVATIVGIIAWILVSSLLAALVGAFIAFVFTLIGGVGRGGFGGGGFGGGGFGGGGFSGGGGGFGGGGASGSW